MFWLGGIYIYNADLHHLLSAAIAAQLNGGVPPAFFFATAAAAAAGDGDGSLFNNVRLDVKNSLVNISMPSSSSSSSSNSCHGRDDAACPALYDLTSPLGAPSLTLSGGGTDFRMLSTAGGGGGASAGSSSMNVTLTRFGDVENAPPRDTSLVASDDATLVPPASAAIR